MSTVFTPSVRGTAKIFLVIVGLSALLYMCFLARQTIGLVLIAGFLALALGPPVDFFDHRLRFPRWLAILTVYLIVFLIVVGIGLLIVPPIVTGVGSLANDLPSQLDHLRHAGWVQQLDDRYNVITELKARISDLPNALGQAAGTLTAVTIGAFATIVKLFTVLTIVFLLLLDGPKAIAWIMRQTPPERIERVQRLSDDIYGVVAGYVAGNLLISVAAGTVTYVTLKLLGLPFAAALAIMMAFLDLIPLVGAMIGGLVIGIVAALVGEFPLDLIVWGVVFLIYQQAENNLLQPLVYRKTVAVHPIIVIVAVLIGAGLLGVLGALIAIPVAAAFQVLLVDWWEMRGSSEQPPPSSVPDVAPVTS